MACGVRQTYAFTEVVHPVLLIDDGQNHIDCPSGLEGVIADRAVLVHVQGEVAGAVLVTLWIYVEVPENNTRVHELRETNQKKLREHIKLLG